MAAFQLLWGVPVLLMSCSSLAERRAQDVNELLRHEKYREAVEVAADQARRYPRNSGIQKLYRATSVAYLLEQGRRAGLAGDDDLALEYFQQARQLEPENPHVRTWLLKTHDELAERWLNQARESHANDDLEEAAQAYERTLDHSPGLVEAIVGLERVSFQMNHRAGLEDHYYRSGNRAQARWELNVARHEFAASTKYAKDNPRSSRRAEQIDLELSRIRLRKAERLEAEGLYAAARNEYRVSAQLNPDNAPAREGYQRCRTEVLADRKLADGEMMIRRGLHERARQVLEEGRALTLSRQEQFDAVEAMLEEALIEQLYQEARDFEAEVRYREAAQGYARLLEMRETYKDAVARRDTLRDYIHRADELYAEFEKSQDPDEQLSLLRQIEIFWRDYRDVQQRIEALEAR